MNSLSSVSGPLSQGQRIGGFEVDAVLQLGRQGVRYGARRIGHISFDATDDRVIIDELLPTAIAVRTGDGQVRPRSSADELLLAEVRRRFEAEVEALCVLNHRGLARYYFSKRERGTNYAFSEWLPEESLAGWLPQSGALTRQQLLHLILPVIDAVAALHQGGQVHGGINTDTIRVRSDGSGVLGNLQPARHFMAVRLGLPLGEPQPGFGAPEQLEDPAEHRPTQKMLDTPAADVYALGAVLYHLMVGQTPLSAVQRQAASMDPLPSAVACGPKALGEGLLQVVDEALALDPQARPMDGRELRDRLLNATSAPEGHTSIFHRYRPRSRVAETAGWVLAVAVIYLGGWLGWHLGVIEDAGQLLFGKRAGEHPYVPSAVAAGSAGVADPSGAPSSSNATEDIGALSDDVPALPQPDLRGLLAAASGALRASRVTTPVEDNAFDRYLFVLGIDANNQEALAGIDQIIAFYVDRAEAAQALGRSRVAIAEWRQALSVCATLRAQIPLSDPVLRWLAAEQQAIEVALARMPGGVPAPSHKLTAPPTQEISLVPQAPPIAPIPAVRSASSTAHVMQQRLDARVARLISEAERATAAGRVLRARQLYRTVLTLRPGNEDAENGLAALDNGRVRLIIPPLVQ